MISAKLIQAPIAVASASPTCASAVNERNTIFSAILTATAVSAALTVVAVSPRARNVATTLRISTNGISPIV